MTYQAKKWTDEGGRLDYDQVANVPHFASLDDDDWFLPDIGVAPGAKIDNRTFSIAADVCQDGRGIWAERPVTARSFCDAAVDADLDEIERLERVLALETAEREKLARRRARSALNAERAAKRKVERQEAERQLAIRLELEKQLSRNAEKHRRQQIEQAQRNAAQLADVDGFFARERQAQKLARQDWGRPIQFVVDESAGYFDLVVGEFPTNPRELRVGLTMAAKRVSVRGNGETYYGWPGD